MASAIPDSERHVAPLKSTLEESYAKRRRHTRRSIKVITLRSLFWGGEQDTCFKDIQDNLCSTTELGYPRKRNFICLYTDASINHSSGVVTQTDPLLLERPFNGQRHEPLGFLGGRVKGAEQNYSTCGQEEFVIEHKLEKLYYIFLSDLSLHVFMDHPDLLFLFASFALEPTLGSHVVSKLQQWAVFLSRFQ